MPVDGYVTAIKSFKEDPNFIFLGMMKQGGFTGVGPKPSVFGVMNRSNVAKTTIDAHLDVLTDIELGKVNGQLVILTTSLD